MSILHSKFYILHSAQRGQATLSLVFLIGGIILLIAVTLAVLVASFLNSGYGFQASNRALAGAQAGMMDAYLQLVRNRDFAGSYSFPNGSSTVAVTVTQNSPQAGKVAVISAASVQGYQRKLNGTFNVSDAGEVTIDKWDLSL